MEIRKAIKKVVALTAGVTMLGATMMGAMAADLSAYPSPFVKDGQANTVVVVGEKAMTADVVGAIDIAASLQAAAVSKVAVTVTGSGVSVVGGEDVDVDLGDNAAKNLKDNDLPALLDTKIDFNDNDIDVHEEIISTTDLKVVYSLQAGADDEFEDAPYLTTQALGTLTYQYVFDELVNATEIGDGTGEDILEISFLGKNIEITAAATDEITVKASKEYFAAVGDVINVDGHTVTLINVGSEAVVVKVDGQTKTITTSATFDEAGDYKVEISDIFYVDEKEDRSVTLALGEDITTTVETGDSMELFGYDADEDEADWLWDISIQADGTIDYIGAKHNFIMKNKDAPDSDERPAVAVGEKIMFPNDYAYVLVASLETDTYETLTVQPKAESLAGTQYDVIQFTHSGDDELYSVGGVETDTVWAVRNDSSTAATNVTFWYDDDGDDVQSDAEWFTFTVDGDAINITFDGVDQFIFEVDVPVIETWNLTVGRADTDAFNDYFGANEGDAEADELVYEGTNIGTTDTKVLSKYGIKSKDDPEAMMDDDKLELIIPDEQQKVKVVFGTSGTSVAGTSSSGTSDKVNVISVGLGVLDKDARIGSQNMIVVGGPCVNTIAAELMGNPANCAEGFEMGKAMVKLYENNGKTAMLVAGYSALDTQGATRVVSQYDKYDMSGSEAEITVTSLNSISVQ